MNLIYASNWQRLLSRSKDSCLTAVNILGCFLTKRLTAHFKDSFGISQTLEKHAVGLSLASALALQLLSERHLTGRATVMESPAFYSVEKMRNAIPTGDPTNVQWYKDTSAGFFLIALLMFLSTLTTNPPATGAEKYALDQRGYVVPTSTVTGAVTEQNGGYYLVDSRNKLILVAYCTSGKVNHCYGPVTLLHGMHGAEIRAELCGNTATKVMKSGKQIYRLHILNANERSEYVLRKRLEGAAITSVSLILALFFYLGGEKARRIARLIPTLR